MRVCLDTNVLVRLFVPHLPFTAIVDCILNGRLTIVVSNEILLEYEEIITREFGERRWSKVEAFLAVIARLQRGIVEVQPGFRWAVVTDDPDDNKFVDCAIAGGAEYVVTYDRHFQALRNSGYKPKPISPEELAKEL